MIKKLKWKFIIINMAFVASILAVILGLFFYSSSKHFVRQTEMALAQAIDKERFPPPFKVELGNKEKENVPPPIPSFVVTLNSDHSVKSVEESNITVTTELTSSLVRLVDSKDLTQGVLSDYSLRYIRMDGPQGIKIGFADQSYELNNIKTFAINCFLFFLVALVLFFLLSLYLSRLALKPVEAAWQQQNQFIADASHELKTPLTVILANLDILASHEDRTIQDQSKWLNNTKEEASRMKQLVENLLFLARSDAGVMNDVIHLNTLVDFSNLVLKSTLVFESVAFENKVALENKIETDIMFNGCESQLKQVVSILLDNACKYAEKNGTISIELKKSNHLAVLAVCNSGEVIPPEEQIHIFERFYRTDKSRVRKEGGYGLGLSIAKTIIEHHKGKINVVSSKPDGTIFTVTLPLQP
jgi:two-component system sensor histidine kinase CiaH